MADVDLRRHAAILRKWLWLIALCTALAAGASYHASQSVPPTYRTSLTLMVGESVASPRASLDDVSASQQLAAIYARMVRRQPILEATVKALGLNADWRELQERVLASNVEGTQFLEVRVVDRDPQRAKLTADEIARQLIALSPTAENLQQLGERRQFVRRQLDELQASIQEAEAALTQKQAALEKEVSARGVLDRQDEIRALELKLTNWRSAYASLLVSYQGKQPNTLSVVEPAFVPTEPISPNVRANVAMAAALGCLLAIGAAYLVEYLNDTVNTAEDLGKLPSLRSLGSIADMGRDGGLAGGPIAVSDPRSPISEAYRVVRTNVQLAAADSGSSVILITSPGLREGKSTTSANLAASFAQAGKRAILVDADLRHPAVHSLFGVSNWTGLTSALAHLASTPVRDALTSAEPQAGQASATQHLRRQLEAHLVATDVPGLRLLPSGPAVAINPAELLASARVDQLLRLLSGMADVVILDGPPVVPVADSAILATKGVAVVLVVEAGKTRAQLARVALDALVRTHAHVLGVVLNRVPRRSLAHYKYYYGNGRAWQGGLTGALRGKLGSLRPRTSKESSSAKLAEIGHAASRTADGKRTGGT